MIKKVKLENGLELILNQDKTKHRTIADLYIKAGGFDNEFYYDNKYYKQPYGIAHFLEHYLLENSIYGNIMNYFGKEYIKSNGITSTYKTNYYISTVHDFKDNLLKLLTIINKHVFDSKKIEETKEPIIAEINRKNDSKYVKLYSEVYNNIYENKVYNINLGSIYDIKNMTIDDIETFYNAFYQPSNQILFLTGNFDDDIIDVIKEFYNGLDRDYKNVERKKIIESKKVKTSDLTIKPIIKDDLFILSYKVDISSLTPLEKNKFDYYISYIYESNFGIKSSLSNYLFEHNLTNFNIKMIYDAAIMKNYVLISLEVYTSSIDEVLKLIFETISNLNLDENEFNKWINNRIINIINQYENVGAITENYLNNMFLYDLEQYDDIEFLKNLNLNELKEIMRKLDFTNYFVLKNC